MNILFIGYWSFNEGLTQSTIIPHLSVLSDMDKVDRIIFISIERDGQIEPFKFSKPKLLHIPLYSKNIAIAVFNKTYDFLVFPKRLLKICLENRVDFIICRGAPAGALGYLLTRKLKIPFAVESFEPHAQYMLESGTWSSFDPRYIMQKYWEKQIKRNAAFLLPVAHNYRQKLTLEGVSEEKIILQPCEVQLDKFTINIEKRREIRQQLKFSNQDIVGIYVGKFGDIYWDRDAFMLFKKMQKYFGQKFRLMILSPQNKNGIKTQLESVHFSIESVTIFKSLPERVPDYLNGADFAFSLIKSTPHRKFCSPIKNGEYWACGLPVLIPDGIGDDSQILKETGLGVVMEDINHLEKYFPQLEKLIHANKREEIRELAIKYRNPERTKDVYHRLIKEIANEKM